MSRHVPSTTSLDPIELAVWSAEFVRARGNSIHPFDAATIGLTDDKIDNAIKHANAAVDDLRRRYDR
jgi:hypothetical protein